MFSLRYRDAAQEVALNVKWSMFEIIVTIIIITTLFDHATNGNKTELKNRALEDTEPTQAHNLPTSRQGAVR